METKDKINKIVELTEHPERFTEEQVNELLRDEECRMLYSTLADAGRAMSERHTVSDDVVDAEWKKFAAKYFGDDADNVSGCTSCRLPDGGGKVRIVPLWRSKIAAACAGFIIVSGVSLAMVIYGGSLRNDNPPSAAGTTVVATVNKAPDIVVYENSRLDSIMTDVSVHYGVTTEYENDNLRALRFHLKWDRNRALSDLIEVVNEFDGINIYVEDKRVMVAEQTDEEEEADN